MSKPPNKPNTPAEVVKPLYRGEPPKHGLFDFFTDMAMEHAASVEHIALESMTVGTMTHMAKPVQLDDAATSNDTETTTIIKKDGKYYVYFHSSELWASWWGTNLSSFSEWAMGLQAEDTIYFYQSGRIPYLPFVVQILNVLDTQCRAKKIFVVDHIIETPLFLLVGDEVQIESTGAVAFSSCIDKDRTGPAERALMPYLQQLYDRAVQRGLLTAEEVKSIFADNRIVFKTAREFTAVAATPT